MHLWTEDADDASAPEGMPPMSPMAGMSLLGAACFELCVNMMCLGAGVLPERLSRSPEPAPDLDTLARFREAMGTDSTEEGVA